MVQITSFAIAALTLASQAIATTCNSGAYYCGYSLLQGSDQAEWLIKIDAALDASHKPKTDTFRWDSLFTCGPNNSIVWDDHCKSNGLSCASPQNTICGGINYCCAP